MGTQETERRGARRVSGCTVKRGAIDHPKMVALADALEVPLYVAVGIMESLWHWTARYAPRGDIGRWSDEAIADGIRWDRAHASDLVRALVNCGWIDAHEEHRLVVHDWSEHADDGVHRLLARSLQTYASGAIPNTNRLGKREKARAVRHFRTLRDVRTSGAREAHDGRTKCAQPEPRQSPAPPEPKPEPEPRQSQSPACSSGLRPARADRAPGEEGEPVSNGKPTSATWDAYASAYEQRYRVPPTRNARVNGQLADFVKRVPQSEAPEIAAFYVRHPKAIYGQRGHPVGLLLADAETLRTEWLTGRTLTGTAARRNERTAANPFLDLVAEERAKGGGS